MHRNYINSTISIIALAILGYLTYAIWTGLGETLHAISRLGITGIGIVLSLSLVNYMLRFLRWQWYLSAIDYQQLSIGRSLRYYLSGFAFTTTPGKAGEMVRSLFLKRHGVTYPQSLSMFFVERLSDLLATLILGALIFWQFDNYQKWLLIPITAAFLLITAIHHSAWLIHLQQFLITRVSPRVAHLFDRLVELVLHSRTLLKYQFLYGSLLLSLCAWGAEGIGFYYILKTIGINSGLSLAVGIYAMSLIIGALSFLPGGLGGTEAAMLIMLATLGASREDALAATLICRFATLWFAVALGAVAMMGLKLEE
jgi:uncharacterized protein (TIRG00374 family)